MAKLLFNSAGGQAQELHLNPGVIRVGRNSANDVQIEHPSVSSFHCELSYADDLVRVKDLGSTNGTFVERRPIQETALSHGQRLQLGSVEMILDAPAAQGNPPSAAAPVSTPVQAHSSATQAPPRPRLSVRLPKGGASASAAPVAEPAAVGELAVPESPAVLEGEIVEGAGSVCKYHPRSPSRWQCGGCHQFYCDLCVAARPGAGGTRKFCRACGAECRPVSVQIHIPEMQAKGFFALLPGVFVYPFRKNGIWMLAIGMIVFAVLSFAARFSWWALIFGTGYFLSYMQRIMTCSGYGEDEMPGWPDFSDFLADIVMPMLLLAGTFLACLLPGLACLFFGSDTVKMAAIPLFVLGGFYLPMAVLAVGMTDNIFSLNPLVIIPSIAKLFVPYLVATLFVGVLYGVYKLSQIVIEAVDVPVLSSLIVSLLSLYFTTVQMRILGLLYFTNKERLGWFNRGG